MTEIRNTILITGVAGFIGANLALKLVEDGQKIVGIDDLNNYYDQSLKEKRLKLIHELAAFDKEKFIFHKISIEDNENLEKIFLEYKPNIVIHLAAQAGVRNSIINPQDYVRSNLVGFANILESCRNFNIEHFIFASSSSVYGGNSKLPYSENDSVNHPISFYAATKRSNELMAHSYSHLFGIPSTGLRFFTVYGPWGRPDMAPMIFANSIISKKPINVFNYGKMKRDFTYIDDVVDAIRLCLLKKATVNEMFNSDNPSASSSFAPYRILNIGNNKPIELMYFINLLEEYLGEKAIINFKPLQQGDVLATYADINSTNGWIGFDPSTSIEIGLNKFAKWYLSFYS